MAPYRKHLGRRASTFLATRGCPVPPHPPAGGPATLRSGPARRRPSGFVASPHERADTLRRKCQPLVTHAKTFFPGRSLEARDGSRLSMESGLPWQGNPGSSCVRTEAMGGYRREEGQRGLGTASLAFFERRHPPAVKINVAWQEE